MESALYGIYALVVFVSEILLVRCAHSFDFWYVNKIPYARTFHEVFSIYQTELSTMRLTYKTTAEAS